MMQNERLLIGYLTYVNKQNSEYRYNSWKQSSLSLQSLRDYDVISVDNNSISEVRNDLLNARFESYVHLPQNYFDVALFYATLWRARALKRDYVLFLYDDTIITEPSALSACVEAMDKNPSISHCRVMKYSFHQRHRFDSAHTPKKVNPDSVNHRNDHTGDQLVWSETQVHKDFEFQTTNWHYTSRPCLWRTWMFEKMLDDLTSAPVLQGFERECKKRMHERLKPDVLVLNEGLGHTTHVDLSARTRELPLRVEESTRVDLQQLRAAYDSVIHTFDK